MDLGQGVDVGPVRGGLELNHEHAIALMDSRVERSASMHDFHFKREAGAGQARILGIDRAQPFHLGMVHDGQKAMAEDLKGLKTKEAFGVTGQLDDLELNRVDSKENPMRLNGARDVNWLLIAICEVYALW